MENKFTNNKMDWKEDCVSQCLVQVRLLLQQSLHATGEALAQQRRNKTHVLLEENIVLKQQLRTIESMYWDMSLKQSSNWAIAQGESKKVNALRSRIIELEAQLRATEKMHWDLSHKLARVQQESNKQNLREAIIKIQTFFRRWDLQKDFKTTKKGIILLQALARTKKLQTNYRKIKKGMILLQAIVRRRKAFALYQTQRRSVINIQTWYRIWRAFIAYKKAYSGSSRISASSPEGYMHEDYSESPRISAFSLICPTTDSDDDLSQELQSAEYAAESIQLLLSSTTPPDNSFDFRQMNEDGGCDLLLENCELLSNRNETSKTDSHLFFLPAFTPPPNSSRFYCDTSNEQKERNHEENQTRTPSPFRDRRPLEYIAAVAIQKLYRGYSTRKHWLVVNGGIGHSHSCRHAAVAIQRFWRGHSIRNHIETELVWCKVQGIAATVIQRYFRGNKLRALFSARIKPEHTAASIIQRVYRSYMARGTGVTEDLIQVLAVRVIRRYALRHAARRRTARNGRIAQHSAAVAIQKLYRGYSTRKHWNLVYDGIEEIYFCNLAAVAIQRFYRGHMTRTHIETEFIGKKVQDLGATIIQQYYKGYIASNCMRTIKAHGAIHKCAAKPLNRLVPVDTDQLGGICSERLYRNSGTRALSKCQKSSKQAVCSPSSYNRDLWKRTTQFVPIPSFQKIYQSQGSRALFRGKSTLSSQNQPESKKDAAAVTIQHRFSRHKLQVLFSARGKLDHTAASTIQRVYRGVARGTDVREEQIQVLAVRTIQRCAKRHAARRHLHFSQHMKEKEILAALSIQRWLRTHAACNRMPAQHSAAVAIQKLYRGYSSRKHWNMVYGGIEEIHICSLAAVAIQRFYRGHMTRTHIETELIRRKVQDLGATIIQRYFRGHILYDSMRSIKEHRATHKLKAKPLKMFTLVDSDQLGGMFFERIYKFSGTRTLFKYQKSSRLKKTLGILNSNNSGIRKRRQQFVPISSFQKIYQSRGSRVLFRGKAPSQKNSNKGQPALKKKTAAVTIWHRFGGHKLRVLLPARGKPVHTAASTMQRVYHSYMARGTGVTEELIQVLAVRTIQRCALRHAARRRLHFSQNKKEKEILSAFAHPTIDQKAHSL